jgi:thymidylate synthase (FAD)
LRLVKPLAEVLHINIDSLQLIELAGRTCYKSEDKMTNTPAPAFAAMVIKRGHESVIEHATATARFVVDRGVSHEIVRHRLASYSQESTRYCDYEGGHVAFIIPPWCATLLPGEASICTDDAALNTLHETADQEAFWLYAMQQAEDNYKRHRVAGWRPEQARAVLPNSLKTEIVMTANLREWRHFFRLRTAAAAHPQMREVACPLLAKMRAFMPVVFDDVGTTESAI